MTREQSIEQHLRNGLAEVKALEADYCRVRRNDDDGRACVEINRIVNRLVTKRAALRRAITAAAEELGRTAQADADRRLAAHS